MAVDAWYDLFSKHELAKKITAAVAQAQSSCDKQAFGMVRHANTRAALTSLLRASLLLAIYRRKILGAAGLSDEQARMIEQEALNLTGDDNAKTDEAQRKS